LNEGFVAQSVTRRKELHVPTFEDDVFAFDFVVSVREMFVQWFQEDQGAARAIKL
jgi:hypothetical protein